MERKLERLARSEEEAIEEGNSIINLNLNGPFDARVDGVEMVEKSVDMVLLEARRGIVNITTPPKGWRAYP